MGSILLFILAALAASTSADTSDITTIYRIHDPSSYSIVDEALSPDTSNTCSDHNGGCQVKCISNGGRPRCSCPSGYELNADQKTCSGDNRKKHVLLGSSGTIYSPNFPQDYNSADSVSWLIVGPEKSRVTLKFTHFNTESGYDYVTLSDENERRINRFSGSSIPQPIQASSNKMLVIFSTDSSGARSGFQAHYHIGSVSASEELHLRGNSLGILVQGPNGTYLEPDVSIPELKCGPDAPTCPWKRIGKWNSKRQFMDDVLPSLRIRYGGQFCEMGLCQGVCRMENGENVCICPDGYTLDGDNMNCHGISQHNQVLTARSGHFTSTNYPSNYPHQDLTTWLIIAPDQSRIHLSFSDFVTEVNYDFLEVYDGPSSAFPVIGRYSGASIPNSLTSTSKKLYIRFSSDNSNSRSGFVANYTTLGGACSAGNGGCQGTCLSTEGAISCLCPEGFTLISDGMTCVGVDANHNVQLNTSGEIRSAPSTTSAWLLVAPQYYRFQLNFIQFNTESQKHFMEVYDGPSASSTLLGHFSGTELPRTLVSSHNKLFVISTFGPDDSLIANYTTERGKQAIATLSSSEGRLESPLFLPPYPELCVSIISKLSNTNGGLWVSANPTDRQELNMTRTHVNKVGRWHIEQFTASLAAEDITHPLTVSAHVTGTGSSIFSIMGCNPYENEAIYTIHRSMSLDKTIKPVSYKFVEETQISQTCYNGGVWNLEREECICPNGFHGADCQKGCGPNSYGQNCTGVCSIFDKGCSKMVFCKSGLPCLCAPGFEGDICDTPCSGNRYGASCLRVCGQCLSERCNALTGECDEGCKAGYFPPLCQDKYKKLASAPTIDAVDFKSTVIRANLSATIGQGTTKFLVVQYKEVDQIQWQQLLPLTAEGVIVEAKITGLRAGIPYIARVLLIDEDGNVNEHEDIPMVTWKTRCSVPTSDEYHITSCNGTSSGFEISWDYDMLDSTWCPLLGYEISFPDRGDRFWNFVDPRKTKFHISNLLPGRHYSVRVQAVTEKGKAPFSTTVSYNTEGQAPGQVRGLKAVREGHGKLRVTWEKPQFTGGTITNYHLEYKCLRILGCNHDCRISSGHMEITGRTALLTDLIPHAQYSIKVAGKSKIVGPFKTIFVASEDTEPTTIPEVSSISATEVTNKHFIAHWNAPSDCTGLNGYLQGYRYELVKATGSDVIHSGITQDRHVNFTGLTPNTQYQVKVQLVTSGSTNHVSNRTLTFIVKTTATVPESVQHLTVYKKGRRMIGVRWPAPNISLGKLKSFTVSYRQEDGDSTSEVSQAVGLEHCAAWPELYCHTINGLVPDTHYVVSVRAQSTELDTDSTAVTVKTITREGGPGEPSYLKVLNSTQHSLVVEWGQPNMINGVLRSFLLNVEETGSVNITECCEYFPIHELPVRSEQMRYRHEVVGLSPASTFTISVTAKTVTMGPTVNITAHTPPITPVLVQPPKLQPRASESDPLIVSLPQAQHHPGLRSTYLLLALTTDDKPVHLIQDQHLAEQLAAAVNHNFYIVGEFTEADLAEEKLVGILSNEKLTKGVYRLGLALVLDYNGAKSFGFISGESFTIA